MVSDIMMRQDSAEHESAGLQMRMPLMGALLVADRVMPVVDRDEDADDVTKVEARPERPELLRQRGGGPYRSREDVEQPRNPNRY